MSKTILLDSLREMLVPIRRLLDLKADRAVVDKKAENVDYNENNPKSKGYIANRPCYVDEKNKVVPIDKKFLPDASTYLDEEILRPDYGIDNPNKLGFIKNRPCYYKQIGSYVNSERIELSPTSETYIDWPIQFEENAEYLVKAYMRFDGNGEYGELSFEEYAPSYASRVIWLSHLFRVPSSNTSKEPAGINAIYSTDSISYYPGKLVLFAGRESGRYIEPGNLKVEICALKKLEEPVIPDEIARVAYVDEKVASIPQPDPYTLPTASAEVKGGVKIGEGLQMTGDVLGVVPEGVYELIETITLEENMQINLTAEPDGTPYNFAAVRVKGMTECSIDAAANLYAVSRGAVVCSSYFSALSDQRKRYRLDDFCVIGGFWETQWVDWNINSSSSSKTTNYHNRLLVYKNSEYPTITHIKSGSEIPAGTYEIWAVRA